MTKGIIVIEDKQKKLYVVDVENDLFYYCPTGKDYQMISKSQVAVEVEICGGCEGLGTIPTYNPDVESEFDVPCETCKGRGYVS